MTQILATSGERGGGPGLLDASGKDVLAAGVGLWMFSRHPATDLVHLIRDPMSRQSLEVAFGTANGNMRYSLSIGFQAQILDPEIGRALSDTRDDLILGVWTPPQPFELRIVSLR